MDKILSQRKDNLALIDAILKEEDNLFDNKEKMQRVEGFFKNQVQVFDAAVKMEEDLKNDLNYLRKEEEANEALNQIRLITVVQSDPKSIYRRIPELNGLMDKVREGHGRLLDDKRAELLEIIRQCMEEVHTLSNGDVSCIKYMKSVVAFANGTGGKIIFGIADKTREVIGFDKEDVLQETIIIKVRKTLIEPKYVTITSSKSNNDFGDLTSLEVPYNLVVSGKDNYVYLVTNEEEVEVLECLHKFDKTLPDIGLKMKTGLTVDFRNRDILRDTAEEGAIPLFYSQHIKQGKIHFPIQKEHEYVLTDQKGLMQDNKNYLFVKRFTAKEEPRRLQCGIYLAKNYPQYTKISTQNKINFIDGVLQEMSECLVYGLYVLFNSTLYDEYYRILNGSTQVNSTEINAMPVPDLNSIQEMGRRLMKSKDLSENNCNLILEGYCG